MSDGRGHLVLFLHAHLPYVRHPEHEEFLEEDWLYEAITETYLPLLAIMEGWVHDKVPARLTMSLTPPLCEMLRDPLLVQRYSRKVNALAGLAEREMERTKDDLRFSHTAQLYRNRLKEAAYRFDHVYDRDVVRAFGKMQEAGVLEIVTCSATHAFLPNLFNVDPSFARAQIRLGAKSYRKHFGRNPPGIWLPECGYVPGLEDMLAEEGICYFMLDSHGVAFADPKPVFGTMAPIVSPSGVLAFPRDPESSKQVWSAEEGYPGDARYREFYRDIGYDLPDEHLVGFTQATGERKNVGIKYYRITGRGVPLDQKEPYHRGWAMEAADSHAGNFVFNRSKQIEWVKGQIGRAPVVVAPYDAELFGHWWYEGPEFIDQVVRKATYDQHVFRLSTPTDVIRSGADFQVATPAPSSWGAHGYGEVWCNDGNDWIWMHVHRICDEMARIAGERRGAWGLEERALNQMAREVLLASASDWPFIITMGTMVGYAERRVREHVNRFNWLLDAVRENRVDEAWLKNVEEKDNIFSFVDFRDFAR
jgi:1,4-alpha-glucan branching enzyme